MTIPIELLRKLPKAALHEHLDGSLRVSTIIELAAEQGIELPTTDEAELRKIVSGLLSIDITNLFAAFIIAMPSQIFSLFFALFSSL